MEPTLHSGDCVLVNHKSTSDLLLGNLVVVRHPQKAELTLIKRVSSFGSSSFSVSSDNPFDSQDSREFGPLKMSHVIGVVTAVFFKDGKIKLIN